MRSLRCLMVIFFGVCLVVFVGCKKDEPAVADKPKPPAFTPSEPARPAKKQTPPIRKEKPAVEMLIEDEYQAGKLLGYAKMMIDIGTKYTTPKAAIETCRQIIKDYPGTKYAEEARMLLRRVSAKDRKKYKITNEELGL